MPKLKKGLAWTLIILGLDTITPPYPSSDILWLAPLYAWYFNITSIQQLKDPATITGYITVSVVAGLTLIFIGHCMLAMKKK